LIVNTSLENGVGYAGYDTNRSMVSIFVNELATCRWDIQDNDYSNLGNSFACSSSSADGLNYECETSLDASQGSKFYIKCQDYAGNVNSESYVLTIYPTESLNITNILPSGTLYDNNVVLSASTVGGAEGNAECRFSETSKSYSEMVRFFETGSSYYSQSLNLERGSYDYKIKCKDKAGNLADGSASFVIDVDSNAPEVLSISRGGGQISILLNEQSMCEYSTQSFSFGEGNSLNDNLNILFSIPITEDSFEYYFICEDEYNNRIDEMKIII